MTQKIINIGSSPNKGDGDVLRTAFSKINDNFTELFNTNTSTKYHLGDDTQFIDVALDGSGVPTGEITIQSGFNTAMPVYIKGGNALQDGVGGNVIIEAGAPPLADASQLIQGSGPYAGTVGDIEMAANQTTIDSLGSTWTFGNDGILTLPVGGVVSPNGYSGSSTTSSVWAVGSDYAGLDWKGTNTLYVSGPGIEIYTNSNGGGHTSGDENYWLFSTDGNLTLPAGGIIKNFDGTEYGSGSSYNQSLNTTDNVTFNRLKIANGLHAPAAGGAYDKIKLYDFADNAKINYAIGTEDHHIWMSVDATSAGFKWYGGTNRALTLTGDGTLTLANGVKVDVGTANKFTLDQSTVNYIDLRDVDGRGYYTDSSGYTLRSNGTYSWIFDEGGILNLPNSTTGAPLIQATNDIQINADGLVFTFGADGNLTIPNEIHSVAGVGDVVIESNNGTAHTWRFSADSNLTLPEDDSLISYVTAPHNVVFSAGSKRLSIAGTGRITLPEGFYFANSTGSTILDRLSYFTDDLTITASRLTGTTLASGVTASSLTSVGQLSNLVVTGTVDINSTEDSINADTGALQVAGGATIGKNLIAIGTIYAGQDSYTEALTNPLIVASSPANAEGGYSQVALLNNTATASGDYQVFVDGYDINGPAGDTGWVDMGIAGTNFSDERYTITNPQDGYIFVSPLDGANASGNLVLGTDNTGSKGDIVFATGGFLATNEKMRLKNSDGSLNIKSGLVNSETDTVIKSGTTRYAGITVSDLTNNGTELHVPKVTHPNIGDQVYAGYTVIIPWRANLVANVIGISSSPTGTFGPEWIFTIDQDVHIGFAGGYTVTFGTGTSSWTFSTDGKLQLPAGGTLVDSEGETILGFASTSDSGFTVNYTILSTDVGVNVLGDATPTFTAGMEIQFASISGAEFEVATVTYDLGTNSTNIILAQPAAGFGPVDGDTVYLEYHGVTEIYAGENIALGVTDSNTGRVLTISALTQHPNYIANGTSGVVIPGENANITVTVAGGSTWTFDDNSNLTLPVGGDIKDSNGNTVLGATSYTLPKAVAGDGLTTGTLGGVIPDGSTIIIDANGVISSTGGTGGYSLPTASHTTLGGVKVDASTINIDGSGIISAVIPTSLSAFTNDPGYLTSVTNIPGNAGTVTNGVYTTGSYANPSWITSLAGSKITGTVAGNAATATKLAASVTINGVAFDGSGNITVTAAAGTLTGNTLNSGVTQSSLTSVGTLVNLTVTNPITGSVTGSAGSVAASALTGNTLASGVTTSSLTSVGTLTDLTVTNTITGSISGSAPAGSLSGSTLASGVTASSLTSVGTLTGLTVGGTLTRSGAVSAAAWGTAGIGLRISNATYTDTSSTGTLGTSNVHYIGQPTLSFNSATTVGQANTVYISNAPAAGTNATITAGYALNVAAGNSYFASNIRVGGYIQSGGGASMLYVGNSSITVQGDITTTGNVLMANRPAFRVYGAGTTNNLSTTQNTNGILNNNNYAVDYQQGTALVTSTGIFTAPVAGLYSIHLNARVTSNTASASQVCVVKNYAGTPVTMVMWEHAANPTVNHFGVSTIAKLAANDTLVLKVTQGSINFDANDSWSVAFIG